MSCEYRDSTQRFGQWLWPISSLDNRTLGPQGAPPSGVSDYQPAAVRARIAPGGRV